MIISDSHKFIFVWNFRTGGTSIRKVISQFRSTKAVKPKPKKLGLHASAAVIEETFPDKFKQYYTFGFVRNPWDWLVSTYLFVRATKGHFRQGLLLKMTFNEFVIWKSKQPPGSSRKGFFTDGKGNQVDFIGRFENLAGDFNKICRKIGIKGNLPHLNKVKGNRHYSEFYNGNSIDLVAGMFKEDIKYFNYKYYRS